MKKKIFLITTIFLLGLVIVNESYSLIKTLNNKTVLEEVRIVNLKNDKSIAIMVQDTNTDEWHEADNRDSWPSPKTHGFVGAECTDSEGDTLKWEDILTFDLTKQIATIKTKQTAYCTLYFAKGEPALDWLKKKGGTTFAGSAHTTVIDGMYRFVGTKDTVTNNYICFGTTVESQCLNDAKTYMYRIIGITSSADTTIGLYANQLKIIRATPLNTNQKWNNTAKDIKWDASSIKNYLNGTTANGNSKGFLQTIIDGTNGAYWESMISSHKWYIKVQTNIGNEEPKDAENISDYSKIGLIYATDYMNSGDGNSNNWLFIANGWTGNSSVNEWTMTKYGWNGADRYDAWYIYTGYPLNTIFTNEKVVVRPVFYLQSGVNLTGEGNKEHPYIITTMNNA